MNNNKPTLAGKVAVTALLFGVLFIIAAVSPTLDFYGY